MWLWCYQTLMMLSKGVTRLPFLLLLESSAAGAAYKDEMLCALLHSEVWAVFGRLQELSAFQTCDTPCLPQIGQERFNGRH